MFWLFILILSIHPSSSYDCNMTVFGGRAYVDSVDLCNYINYHIAMAVVCGAVSLSFSLMSVLVCVHACCNLDNTQKETVMHCATWALVFAMLSLGFEGGIALLIVSWYLLIIVVLVHKTLSMFASAVVVPLIPNVSPVLISVLDHAVESGVLDHTGAVSHHIADAVVVGTECV